MSRGGRQQFAGINDKIRKFSRMARARGRFEAYEAAVSERTAPEISRLIRGGKVTASAAQRAFAAAESLDPAEQFMHFDTVRYLPGDLLTKVDRASMAVSLEAREPFLDHEMARLAVALPLNWKIRDGQNKYALRRILARHLDAKLFDRPKKGFSVPIGKWLRGALRDVVHDELSESSVRRVGILDAQAVQEVLRDFMSGGQKTSPAAVWFLFQLQQWGRRWL
jgi:asparagine synthase (glutamine-hydrolysing)